MKILTKRLNTNPNELEISQEEGHFVWTESGAPTKHKLFKIIANTKKRIDIIDHWSSLNVGASRFKEPFLSAAKRGVKFRFITEESKNEKLCLTLQTLQDKDAAQIKVADIRPRTTILIADEKETIFSIKSTDDPLFFSPNLWSDNKSLLSIFQEYFNLKWKTIGK
jgi:hypothetical protein